METSPVKFRCLGFLLQRWRLFLLAVVCSGVLCALFLSSLADPGVPDPGTWLRLLLRRRQGSSEGEFHVNDSSLLPVALVPSVVGEEQVDNDLGKSDGEQNLKQLDINESADLLGSASDTKHEESTLVGEEAHRRDTRINITSPFGEPVSSPEVSSAITGIEIPQIPAKETILRRKNASSEPQGDKLLHQGAYHNTSKETSAPISSPARVTHCDMSVGRWVHDDSYPRYRPGSCPYVDEGFSCQRNGRPDSDYMKWKWKPKDCEIPRFNASKLLERLRGKRLVFAGDSLNRNQWESMLCLLREGLANKSRMLEIHRRRITKEEGAFVFKFLDYNCRVEFYRSHFLVAEGKRPRTASSKARRTLRLDTMDKIAKKWKGADILVFTTGHWWSHSKTAAGKDYFQEGDAVYGSLSPMIAFRKAISTWGSWVDQNVNPKSTQVFFCGYSPRHFNGGQWNSGGHCNMETDPIFNESYIPGYPDKMLVIEDILRQMKVPVKLLNVSRFSEFRKDAHPSIYGHNPQEPKQARGAQDCSHWCLPGLPDVWNEILYALLIEDNVQYNRLGKAKQGPF